MSLNILIKTVPHDEQRYPTVGDWQTPEEGFQQTAVVVSDMANSDYEFAVAVHELIEMHLAMRKGVSPNTVTDFDVAFEAKRPESDVSEPGDDPQCPVYREHQLATIVERLLIEAMGLHWETYNNVVENL